MQGAVVCLKGVIWWFWEWIERSRRLLHGLYGASGGIKGKLWGGL